MIFVMDHGRIVERGDHATLMAESGTYRRLYELQFEDAPPAAGPREPGPLAAGS
jgi:ABC-type transport system involved in cytochrome bd biosynthesis fused ATPase/permease subunit